MLNHYLSQKLKLTGNSKFSHLINTLTLLFTDLNSPSISEAPHIEYLIKVGCELWRQGSNSRLLLEYHV
jgi:hypothetical protein